MDILGTKTQEKLHNMVAIHEFADGVVSARPFDARETWFYDSAERCAIDCGGGYQRQSGDCREVTPEKAREKAKQKRKQIRTAFDHVRNNDGTSGFEYATTLTCYDTDFCKQPRLLMTKVKAFLSEFEDEIGEYIAVLEYKDGSFHVHVASAGRIDTDAWMEFIGSNNTQNQYSKPIEYLDKYEGYIMKDLFKTFTETPAYTHVVVTNVDTTTTRDIYLPADEYDEFMISNGFVISDDNLDNLDNDIDDYITNGYEYTTGSNNRIVFDYDYDFETDSQTDVDVVIDVDDVVDDLDEYTLYDVITNAVFMRVTAIFDPFVYIYNAREEILRGKAPPGY